MKCFINFKGKEYLEQDFLNFLQTYSKKISSKITLISEYFLHSGGALGGDIAWDQIGEEFGLINTNHYYTGTKTPIGNFEISAEDYEEGRYMAAKAAKRNWDYPRNTMSQGLLIRDWSQVKHADAVFAIGKIVQPGEPIFPNMPNDERVAKNPSVTGGTGYAVGMAILENKPVYVFDQEKEQWFTWSNEKNNFIPTETPTLTKNFAGIGTRQITDVGKQAIRDVYEKTLLKEQLDNETFKDNTTEDRDSLSRLIISSGVNVIEVEGTWTRKDVERYSDKVFLFGDNFEDSKTNYVPRTTQAVIRGLPNAIGISTKNNRGTNKNSYLSDDQFEEVKKHIDEQIKKAVESGKTIVISKNGIGTGKAMLSEKAPKINEYLQKRLQELKEAYKGLPDQEVQDTFSNIQSNFKSMFDKGEVAVGLAMGAEVGYVGSSNSNINTDIEVNLNFPHLSPALKRGYSPIYEGTDETIIINSPKEKRVQIMINNNSFDSRQGSKLNISISTELFPVKDRRATDFVKNLIPIINQSFQEFLDNDGYKSREERNNLSAKEKQDYLNRLANKIVEDVSNKASNKEIKKDTNKQKETTAEATKKALDRYAYTRLQNTIKTPIKEIEGLNEILRKDNPLAKENINMDKMHFESIEHAYQSAKYVMLGYPPVLINSPEISPKDAVEIGKDILRNEEHIKLWDQKKKQVMKTIIKHILNTNETIKDSLLAAEDSAILNINNSNELGEIYPQILLELKEEFQNNSKELEEKDNSSIESDIQIFKTKINQFSYELNTETGEVIHKHKTEGNIVETNERKINKVYVEYAKQMNLPTQNFNTSTYVKVFDKILNIDNANEVKMETIKKLFDGPSKLIEKPCNII